MLTYQYTAREVVSGKKVKADVQANSEQDAYKLLRKEGLSPIEIKVQDQSLSFLKARFNKVSSKDRVLFSRQLSTLINAGLPIIQSLRIVATQTSSKPLKRVIGELIADVEGGTPLSVAAAKHPQVFNQVYISLLAAGETSGTLDLALERLALQQEKDAEIISKVRGAMIYPILVLLVMVAVVGFMIVKVLPQVQTIYNSLPGVSLPLVTVILLDVSKFIIKFWLWVIIALGVLTFSGTRWARTLGGKRIVDGIKMKAWPIGKLFMKMYMARFARTASTLVASGVPLIQVLEVTSNAVNNVHISDSIKKAIDKVKGGKALSEALTGDPNFLPLVPNMLSIGEQSGSMEKMLSKTAEYYEKEVDDEIKNISTIIEPVMMIILGIVAFTIVAAVLLPIYSLAGKSFIQV